MKTHNINKLTFSKICSMYQVSVSLAQDHSALRKRGGGFRDTCWQGPQWIRSKRSTGNKPSTPPAVLQSSVSYWSSLCLVSTFLKMGPVIVSRGFPGGSSGKKPACQCRRHKRHKFHPWAGKIPCRRAWQPTPLFLFGESQGQRSLVGYNPWGKVT